MVRLPGSALVALSLLVATLGWQAKSPAAVLAVSMPPAVGPLDDAAVARAISDLGARPVPLELRDRGGIFSGAGGGYRITMYTPHIWVTHLARQAARVGTRLSVADVAVTDRAQVLRVVASPSAPTVGSSRAHSSAVLRVTVLDDRRRGELAPEDSQSFAASHRVLLGNVRALNGMEATFHLGALDVLRGGPSGEFFVRVEGTGYSKDFKIKRKHLSKLSM
ncbi:MAG: hypothetical protein OSB03_15485 [Vicinamibacterales bacterium]|nr:hypothetical protein [Vicinamibacterales bacterium]